MQRVLFLYYHYFFISLSSSFRPFLLIFLFLFHVCTMSYTFLGNLPKDSGCEVKCCTQVTTVHFYSHIIHYTPNGSGNVRV